jgi:CysZ protein
MGLYKGLRYNLQGLWFGLRNGKLLFWGLLRFAIVLIITLVSATFILAYHQEILDLIWTKPQSLWTVWLWHLLSWLLSLVLVGVSAVISYLISQIVFSALIMDHMSRITERAVTGSVKEPEKIPMWRLFIYLIKQEIPRTILPVLASLIVMVLSWFVALGPIMFFITSGIAIIFLSWDNTDIVPARRLVTFKNRFRLLLRAIPFHIGFGLPFLVPFLNILFLSFAPVGATRYYLERHDAGQSEGRSNDLPQEQKPSSSP